MISFKLPTAAVIKRHSEKAITPDIISFPLNNLYNS
jgi:hypothetical protein